MTDEINTEDDQKPERLSARKVQENLEIKIHEESEENARQFKALDTKIDQMLDIVIKKFDEIVDSRNLSCGPDVVADFNEDGDLVEEIDNGEIGDMNNPFFKEKCENLAFAEDPVTIRIMPTTEKNAAQVFDICVGDGPSNREIFRLGETKTVKRKFVEGILRAKPAHFRCEENPDVNAENGFLYPGSRGMRYNVSLVEDKNPRGGYKWFEAIQAQP